MGSSFKKTKYCDFTFWNHIAEKRLLQSSSFFESFGGKTSVEERNKITDLKSVHRSWALDKVQTEYGDYGINYRYLRKIVDLCKQKGVKLYLVGYPLYNESLTYDHDFCTRMRK